ncbi:MAG: hypothetical protein IKO58_02435 [Prevotella sp.]|nr:hypothetical protein [Prevotella sp.]
MKRINMVIVATMTMAITFTMPAMAIARRSSNTNHDKKAVVTNDRKTPRVDRVDNRTTHFDSHRHASHPDVKTCTIKLGRHDSHRKIAARAENMKGVMDTKWNSRTRELTITYDARITSARTITRNVV